MQIAGWQMETVEGPMQFRGVITNVQLQENNWTGIMPDKRQIIVTGALPRGLIAIKTGEEKTTGVYQLLRPQERLTRQPIPVVIGEVS